MKVGVCCEFPGECSSGDFLKRSAQIAERVGFSSYWFGEHVLLFGAYESKYPYGGITSWGNDEPPIPDPRVPFVDPVMGMALVAAATSTIEIATAVMILPQRNPVVLAKELVCLDEMSGGRLTLGVGVGWCKDEGDAIGIDWANRGKLTDEYIDVMRTLWSEDAAEFAGPTISFKDAYMYPRPVNGSIPIMVGGDSGVALKRVARTGDGWLAYSVPVDEMAAKVTQLREITKQQGRDPDALRISKAIFSYTTKDELAQLREAGVHEFLLFKSGELAFEQAELTAQLEEAAAATVEVVKDW
ncbi:MAG: LLM class F420-dependent oxidoreductase [Novosphingobium sp.]|nr:LLM class F420-dependent oxidoreductase [Novosphingobium sp.]